MNPGTEEDRGLAVAIPERPWALPLGIVAAVALGGLVFWQLAQGRERMESARLTDPAPNAQPIVGLDGVPPPPDVAPMPEPMPEPAPMPVPDPNAFLAPPPAPVSTAALADPAARLKSPALVVDLSEPTPVQGGGVAPAGPAAGQVMAALAPGRSPAEKANPDERFAERLGVEGGGAPAKAEAMAEQSFVVIEGAMIPAVLETAINSDLPGFARAVVTRDVRGFDGAHVLIPKGSKLIGQYRSGVALGQSRAFVIWTRLVRPDGASVQLASPATDELGRGGLEGRVDRHFLRRFGGAILLSLISGAVSAASDEADTQVIIASTRAGGDAAAVALQGSIDVPPTVNVRQGAAIRVFVARDLDFSAVGPAK